MGSFSFFAGILRYEGPCTRSIWDPENMSIAAEDKKKVHGDVFTREMPKGGTEFMDLLHAQDKSGHPNLERFLEQETVARQWDQELLSTCLGWNIPGPGIVAQLCVGF